MIFHLFNLCGDILRASHSTPRFGWVTPFYYDGLPTVGWETTAHHHCQLIILSSVAQYFAIIGLAGDISHTRHQAIFFYLKLICSHFIFVNSLRPSNAYVRQEHRPTLVKITACRLFGAKPSSELVLVIFKWTPLKKFHWSLDRSSNISIHQNAV